MSASNVPPSAPRRFDPSGGDFRQIAELARRDVFVCLHYSDGDCASETFDCSAGAADVWSWYAAGDLVETPFGFAVMETAPGIFRVKIVFEGEPRLDTLDRYRLEPHDVFVPSHLLLGGGLSRRADRHCAAGRVGDPAAARGSRSARSPRSRDEQRL